MPLPEPNRALEPGLELEFDRIDLLDSDQEPLDPEPRQEQQRAEAERLAHEHQQPDSGRHAEDRSRPTTFKRKML